MAAAWRTFAEVIHGISWDQVPADIQHQAARCVLDLTGTLIAGASTDLSRIVRELAATSFGGDRATLLLDGRSSSTAGATLANASSIDAVDAHDGYRLAKGHAGAGIFPAALAIAEQRGWNGAQFLSALVVGYEVALRAAEALHSRSGEYYSSGSWLAIGSAAVAARALGLDAEATRHAAGIADYHAPRSEMMRCIDHPTMLKDGISWGSMTGLVAAELAAAGFTGAPAATLEADSVRSIWEDLGVEWRMRKLYFKPYACCRWAQPAIDAAIGLVDQHAIAADDIAGIEVFTFEQATHLTVRRPRDTEQAQYSLPYPLAAALVFDGLEPAHVQPPYLEDERILRLADQVTIKLDPELDARFPAEALARVRLTTRDGRTLETGGVSARGDPENPLGDDQLNQKFLAVVSRSLEAGRAVAIQRACWECAQLSTIHELVGPLADPIGQWES